MKAKSINNKSNENERGQQHVVVASKEKKIIISNERWLCCW
jgi:hypothetical protein